MTAQLVYFRPKTRRYVEKPSYFVPFSMDAGTVGVENLDLTEPPQSDTKNIVDLSEKRAEKLKCLKAQ